MNRRRRWKGKARRRIARLRSNWHSAPTGTVASRRWFALLRDADGDWVPY